MELTPEMMMDYLYGLPEQFVQCLAMDFSFAAQYAREYRNIVVSGLGGSAIGGDILRSYALHQAQAPVSVIRGYDIPAFVGADTLFLATSYSGNTEETLSAFEQARQKGASIICVSSGGQISRWAEEQGLGLVKVPGGLVPRAATGYLFAPLAICLEKLGIISGAVSGLQETVEVLKELRDSLIPTVEAPENKAREIARRLKDAVPVIWGSTGNTEAAALRWKAQINENAKCPAYYNVFPELNHNEIVGFETPAEILSRLAVVILQDRYDHPRVKRRMEISEEIIKSKVKDILKVESKGESFLARFYSLVYIGDYASTYLALEYGINPTPVKVIDYLKAELAKE